MRISGQDLTIQVWGKGGDTALVEAEQALQMM